MILSASSPTPRRTALGFGLAAIASSGAEAQAGAAYAPEPRRAEAGHVMLLGDSVFDNAAYVAGGPDVVRQVRARLPGGWRATLAARDGATDTPDYHVLIGWRLARRGTALLERRWRV